MGDQFQQLCEILRQGAGLPLEPKDFHEACHVRLISALQSVGQKGAPGTSDLASLIRHMLRREAELQGIGNQSIQVPRRAPYPNRSVWDQTGVTVLNEGTDSVVIQAHSWQPRWLRSGQESPEAYAFAEIYRRNYESEAGDPVLSIIGHDQYQSIGQREAVRAALLAPPGSTLVVNLPTGSGKSLCAQIPALLLSRPYGVTVMIVPTVALAIDQERAMAPFIEHPMAYYGSGTTEGQRRRAEIRERIRNGTQGIVFTSPESVLQSLRPSIYRAAENGMLRMFVIDEAHMVEQWGDDFRPAFQELPGIRKDLLRAAQGMSFKTLLMSGTLTEACLDTLEALYGEPGPFETVSSAQLRPEPSYWFTYCEDKSIQHHRIMDAIRHLPRPLILYTTKREDAIRWSGNLQRVGFNRLATMTGESTSEQRRRVIEQWREREIDIVVATAAFGLGVDQADVRAVVHACIPETLDRFYQEVGRSGRDGKASVSFLAYTRDDFGTARRLNERVSIGVERGRQRWERMFASKEWLPNHRMRVRVDVTPSNESRDINMNNEQNRKWNVRTLTMMSCAGLIGMDAESPSSFLAESKSRKEESSTDTEELQANRDSRVIRVISEDHLQDEAWITKVEAIRERRKSLGHQSLKLMEEALKGKQCIAQLLAAAYRIPSRLEPKSRRSAMVSLACGGCPYCRVNGIQPYAASLPVPRAAWAATDFCTGAHLQQLLRGEKLLIIFYDRRELGAEWEDNLEDLLLWFLKQGVRNVVAPDQLLIKFKSAVRKRPELLVFFHNRFEPLRMPPVPSFMVHIAPDLVPANYLRSSADTGVRILLLPVDALDPVRQHRRLSDSYNGTHFGFEEFRTAISI